MAQPDGHSGPLSTEPPGWFTLGVDREPLMEARSPMPILELEILVHQNMRLFMREQGMTAAQAYEAAMSFILDRLALDAETPEQIGVLRSLLAELRESIVAEYSGPRPDLRDLDQVAEEHHKHRRRRRRQLGRP